MPTSECTRVRAIKKLPAVMARMHRMKERGAEKANFRQLTHKDIEIVLFAVLILLINTLFWTERKE